MSNILESFSVNAHDKYYNIKQFISATSDYMRTKAEDSANLMNRHLQLICETDDLSIFDPHTNVVSEFIVCLHELLSIIEPGCVTSWACVSILSLMCKNPTARSTLIQTYQFIPLLTKLLNIQLALDKKLRILLLMQELSCGIKISWQIPNLSQLMTILTHWIECGEEQIVTLSLAILVNLCYKNLPAVHTLSQCVDIKKFIRICMPLKGLKIEVHVCKLLVILDYMNGKVPEGAFLKLIEVTFKSLIEAFNTKDCMLLQHIVEFFLDIWDPNCHSKILSHFSNYENEVECLLLELENTAQGARGDTSPDNQPECVAILLNFLLFVMKTKQPKLKLLHSRLVNLALKWIQVDVVCSSACEILRMLALNSTDQTCTILDPLLSYLPIFLLGIVNGQDDMLTHTENNKQLTSLMELLNALINLQMIRTRVLAILKQELFIKIFQPLFGTTLRAKSSHLNTYTLEAVLLYVTAIAVINELKKYEDIWKNFFIDLMKHKQIHIILAQAFYSGSKETKMLIMSMSSDKHFPINQVAESMCEFQHVQVNSKQNDVIHSVPDNFNFPLMSVTQIERLDILMNNIKESYDQNLLSVSTADVMELYEYKLASMRRAERVAVASIEAASMQCTHLQHRTSQLTVELSRVRQLWLHTQRSYEDTVKTKETIHTKNTQLQEWLDAEKRRYTSQLSLKEKLLNEKTQLLEDATKQLKEADKEKNILEEKHAELKRIVAKLEDNLLKKEKLVEKKEEQILRSTANAEHLKLQVTQLEKQVKRTETELAARTRELAETSEDLRSCKTILGTITQLTNTQYAKNASSN